MLPAGRQAQGQGCCSKPTGQKPHSAVLLLVQALLVMSHHPALAPLLGSAIPWRKSEPRLAEERRSREKPAV